MKKFLIGITLFTASVASAGPITLSCESKDALGRIGARAQIELETPGWGGDLTEVQVSDGKHYRFISRYLHRKELRGCYIDETLSSQLSNPVTRDILGEIRLSQTTGQERTRCAGGRAAFTGELRFQGVVYPFFCWYKSE